MAHIINQIVTVCTFLCNFQPVLIPLPQTMSDNEVKGYCLELDDTDDELESNSSCSE